MTAAVVLLVYALALAVLAPRLLARGWVDRAPRLAVAAWQAVTASVVLAVVLGALALTFPTMRVSGNLAELLQECVLALRERYASPGGAAVAGAGVVLAVGVAGRVGWCAMAALIRAAAKRRQIREVLAVVGHTDRVRNVVVVDHDEPAAYCVPGARRRIVVTSAALDRLDDVQLRAVLAHERAHLRARHDLVIAWAGALAAAFPRVALFSTGRAEITRLVELLADDAAVAGTDRLTVAEALLNLGGAGGPVGAVAAGGSTTGNRIRRLLAGQPPIRRVHALLGSAAAAALLALPVLVLATPAVLALGSHYCPPEQVTMAGPDCTALDCSMAARR